MGFFKFLVVLIFAGAGGVRQGLATTPCIVPDLSNSDDLPQDQFVNKLTDSCRYDKNVLPDTSIPFEVNATIDVMHLEATQSQFTAHMAVKFNYLDVNLSYETFSPNRSIILGGESLKERIWTPNVLLKDTDDTTVISIDSKDVLISIDPKGSVTFSHKMVAKFDCWLQLQKFPFDHQKCNLAFSDWLYSSDNLQLRWNESSPLNFAPNLHFTEYVMNEVGFDTDTNLKSFVGTFSELTVQLKFHRDVGYYVLVFFIPSYLLVCTAWVTFWLQADAGPPRATLGSSTIVAFITLHLGITKDLPKVSYMKASDIWFLGVMCFIFFSLAEFAFVNVIWRRKKQVELRKLKPKHILKSAVMPRKAREDLRRYESSQSLSVISTSTASIDSKFSLGNYKTTDSLENLTNGHSVIAMPEETGQTFSWTTMTPQEVAIYVDRKARIVFPCVFLVFNILYWSFVYCL